MKLRSRIKEKKALKVLEEKIQESEQAADSK